MPKFPKVLGSQKKHPPRNLEISTRAPDQLGHAIGRLRARAQLSQTSLARNAGIRQATVSKVETGVGTTSLQTIYAICAALGVELVVRSRDSRHCALKLEDIS